MRVRSSSSSYREGSAGRKTRKGACLETDSYPILECSLGGCMESNGKQGQRTSSSYILNVTGNCMPGKIVTIVGFRERAFERLERLDGGNCHESFLGERVDW